MGAKFRVNTGTVRQKADSLEEFNTRFHNSVNALRDQNLNLGSKWEGDARTAFNNEFIKDMDKFDNFYTGIMKFVQALRTDCDNYDKTEAQNTQIASTRTS